MAQLDCWGPFQHQRISIYNRLFNIYLCCHKNWFTICIGRSKPAHGKTWKRRLGDVKRGVVVITWCSGYHNCTNFFRKAWTQAMKQYRGNFTKVIEISVTLLVSSILLIRFMHYVGQKIFGNGSDLDHILTESALLYKLLNTVDLLSAHEWLRLI